MKLIRSCSNVIDSIRVELSTPFILVDVGCAFGIDQPLCDFGEKLIAYGFEPSIEECQWLIRENQNPGVHYIPAFVRLDPSHPFAIAKVGKPHWHHNPWDHLAVARSLESIQTAGLNSQEKAALNLWGGTKLADRIDDVYLNQFLPRQGITSLDLCKIDVDGTDFEILYSLKDFFAAKKVLAVVVEVNYFGSANDTDHTFHNVDRFMRQHGFDLYGLAVNKYSARSLPAPYLFPSPGENITGRPYQADALYILDTFSAPMELTRDRLLKLVGIFALFDLPDWAAEVLHVHGAKHLNLDKINQLLELLTRQIQDVKSTQLNHTSYLAAFDRNDPRFYPDTSKHNSDRGGGPISEELNQLREELVALRESTTWKITAPLRELSNSIIKLKNLL